MNKPQPRTRNRRVNGAARARKALAAYQNQIKPESTDDTTSERVVSLLLAEAEIQRLLALETQGRIGNVYADGGSVHRMHRELKAAEARHHADLVVAQ